MTEERLDHPGVLIHPPVLMLLHLLLAFVLGFAVPLSLPAPVPVTAAGFLIVLAGLGFGFSAVRQFRNANTTLDPHGSVSVIVASGPYRFTRNPIYLGFVSVVIGLPLVFGDYWGVILAPLLLILLQRLVVSFEEAYLEAKFGDAYRLYKSGVRRWL